MAQSSSAVRIARPEQVERLGKGSHGFQLRIGRLAPAVVVGRSELGLIGGVDRTGAAPRRADWSTSSSAREVACCEAVIVLPQALGPTRCWALAQSFAREVVPRFFRWRDRA